MVSIAVAMAAGVLAGDALGLSPGWPLAAGAAAGAVALLLVWRRAPAEWAHVAALIAVACAGAAWTVCRDPHYSQREFLTALPMEDHAPLRVRGWVASPPERQVRPPYRPGEAPRVLGRCDLAVTEVRFGPAEAGGEWQRLRGNLRVTIGGGCGDLQYGDVVEGTVAIDRSELPGNKGEPDAPRRMRRAGVLAAAWVPAPAGLVATGERRGVPGMRQLYAFKRRCCNAIDAALPADRAGIIKCLILGEPNTLSGEQLRRFRETGTLHFLAISGQHVSMIALFCWGVLAGFGLGQRANAAAVLAVVLFYSVLAGFAPSVARAAVMCACYCGGYFFSRRPTLMSSMGLALVVILVANPGDIYNIGLQLSFVAVAGMALLARPIERALFPLPDELDRLQAPEERDWWRHPVRWYVQKTLCVSLAAWLATTPLMAYHFSMITPLAPIASVALLPVVTLAMAAGLPGALLGGLLPGAAHWLLVFAGWQAWLLDWGAELFAMTGIARWYIPPPGWAVVLLAYLAAGCVVAWEWMRRTGWRIAAAGLAVIALYFAFTWHAPTPARPRVTIFSLNRGNSVLVQFPSGRNLLFDAGSLQPDYAQRVLAPALWAQGVRRIDLAVLSHGDTDHTSGLTEVARRIPVGRVAVPAHFERQPAVKPLLEELAHIGLTPGRVAAGDEINGFPGARIEVLWPPHEAPMDKIKDNELSMVLRITTPEGRVLLTGDFGQRAVEPLLRTQPELRADVLQVSHHGLPDFAAQRFGEAVRPRLALVPGGAGMPTPSPYESCSDRLLATDRYGMMSVELTQGEMRVETLRGGVVIVGRRGQRAEN
jgi:competence protein ComEC